MVNSKKNKPLYFSKIISYGKDNDSIQRYFNSLYYRNS